MIVGGSGWEIDVRLMMGINKVNMGIVECRGQVPGTSTMPRKFPIALELCMDGYLSVYVKGEHKRKGLWSRLSHVVFHWSTGMLRSTNRLFIYIYVAISHHLNLTCDQT